MRKLTYLIALILLTSLAAAATPNPGHDASRIGNGTFSAGDFAFQNGLQVNGSTFFVDDNNGRVGVGTAAPGGKLEVESTGEASVLLDGGASSDSYIVFQDAATSRYIIGYDDSANVFNINTGGSFGSNFIVDSSGKIGIGTATPLSQLHINQRTHLMDISGTQLTFNAYNDGSWKYTTTDEASAIQLHDTGKISFFTAASGTAGNAITWGTEKMTISNSGNVGIGTAAPESLLSLYSASYPIFRNVNTALSINNTASPGGIMFYGTGTSFIRGGSGGGLTFYTTSGASVSSGMERLVITDTGDIGIGKTSPGAKLDVNGSIAGNNGLTISAGTVSLPTGQIQSIEIADSTIDEIDLNATNAAANGQILAYNSTTGGFSWISPSTGSMNSFTLGASSGTPQTITDGNTLNISAGTGITTTAAATDTVSVALIGQALALHNLASSGIITRTAANTVTARTITAGTGMTITNGDGVSGNPIITLNNTGVVAATYGSGNLQKPTITVDAQGRITSASTTNIQNATTAQYGVTTLTDSTSSTSTTTAATPNSVKSAYDLANSKASPGNCPAGQAVMNTTSSGVQCVALSTGTVGGSGSQHYVARWTAANTIGTGALWDNTTHVGIGVTSPSAKLTVLDDIFINPSADPSSSRLRLASEQTGTRARVYAYNYYLDLESSGPNQNSIRFFTGTTAGSGTEKMSINGGGNVTIDTNTLFVDATNDRVGVITTTPTASLDVASGTIRSRGSIDIDAGQKITGSYIANSNTEYTYIQMYNPGDASINIGTKHNLGYISFLSGNGAYTERMRIANDGNVGIGNTDANATLHVSGTGRFSSTLTADNGLTVSAGTVSLPSGQIQSIEIEDSQIMEADVNATNAPANGQILSYNSTTGGFTWTSEAGTGSVTSVALGMPSQFTISGSPVTTSGTLNASWASQAANTVLAAPNGVAGTPTFRALVDADIPNAITVNGGTISGTNTVSGTWNTGAALTIGDNGDAVNFDTSTWDVSTGAFTGLTGLTVASGTVSLPAGQIQSIEIEDGQIMEADLNATNAPVNGQILAYNSTNGGFTWTTATSGNVSGSGSANYVASWSSSSGLTIGTLWQNTTHVGIGNAAPTANLHVTGTGRFTGALTLDTQGTSSGQAIHAGRAVNTGNGLTGGGDLTTDRTISISAATCAANEYSYWNGSQWLCRTDQNAGGAMSSWYIAANGTASSQQITDGQTVTIQGGTGITATRSAANVLITSTLGTAIEKNELANSGTLGFTWSNAEVADALTIAGGALNSNNVSGTWTTTGALTVGDNGDNVIISAANWDVDASGNLAVAAINTGPGSTEVHLMNQNVRTTDNVTFNRLTLSQATGTSPLVVSSTTVVSNLNADLLDGQHSTYYLNASNTNTGTLGYAYYSAYGDLGNEGYLDNNAVGDLLTQTQGDGRFVNEAQANSITSAMITDSQIMEADLNASNAPSNGQMLVYNSTTGGFSWTAATTGNVTGSGTNNYVPLWASGSTLQDSVMYQTSSNIGIGTTAVSQKLTVAGNVNVTGNIYYGGNLTGTGADFAERFTVAEEVNPGDVVCLREDQKVERCTQRSQSTVVGVVSTNPTIIGNSEAPNSVAVGIVGIVPTKVTGKIARGDLLTTSGKDGYAEKATVEDFGSIIGKAMESCSGSCTVNVLVGLR